MPISLTSRCRATFHNRTRLPLLPPPSAVISIRLALGYRKRPIHRHQRRIDSTANSAVSFIIIKTETVLDCSVTLLQCSATNGELPGPEHHLPHGRDLKESESGVARIP